MGPKVWGKGTSRFYRPQSLTGTILSIWKGFNGKLHLGVISAQNVTSDENPLSVLLSVQMIFPAHRFKNNGGDSAKQRRQLLL